MANQKTVSNEEIIAALLTHGTVKAAALAVGTSPRTIYDRLQENEFRELYAGAKADILREALAKTQRNLTAAIDTLNDVMVDADNAPAIRLQAAQYTINNAMKFLERLDIGEQNAPGGEKTNPFSIF